MMRRHVCPAGLVGCWSWHPKLEASQGSAQVQASQDSLPQAPKGRTGQMMVNYGRRVFEQRKHECALDCVTDSVIVDAAITDNFHRCSWSAMTLHATQYAVTHFSLVMADIMMHNLQHNLQHKGGKLGIPA
jgi:hypothetical protein